VILNQIHNVHRGAREPCIDHRSHLAGQARGQGGFEPLFPEKFQGLLLQESTAISEMKQLPTVLTLVQSSLLACWFGLEGGFYTSTLDFHKQNGDVTNPKPVKPPHQKNNSYKQSSKLRHHKKKLKEEITIEIT